MKRLSSRRASGGTAGSQDPGYLVLTPLRLKSGGFVIVNRGFVSLDRKEQSSRTAGLIEGETHLTGLMRQPEARNYFTPPDEPAAGRYFTRDPSLIAAHFGLSPAAPFSVDVDDIPLPGGWPKGGTTVLQYSEQSFVLRLDLVWLGPDAAWRFRRFRLAKAMRYRISFTGRGKVRPSCPSWCILGARPVAGGALR